MQRILVPILVLALGAGCATPPPVSTGSASPNAWSEAGSEEAPGLIVAGWRMPYECVELSRRIETSQARLYEAMAGLFSPARATDERRLRALEYRADELGCLVPGSPFSY